MQPTSPAQCNVSWSRLFPFLRWWSLVNREHVRADVLAGLTGAIVVLPQGVAFAMIAGLPPVYGLYTAMIPPIIAGLFGSSRHLISGPTTAISIVVFATVSHFAEPGSDQFIALALTLTFLAGIYQLALGIARMGSLINFISHSVVIGFTAGAALLIATSQLKHYFGIQIPSGQSFIHTWHRIITQIGDANPYVTLVATVTLLTGIIFYRYKPRWPGMLIAMIVGSLLAALLGAEAKGIRLVGELPGRFPPLSLPDFSLESIRALGSSALAIAMLGLVEAVSIARSVATRSGQRIDGNQEFIGQGLANVVGSFFSSYASSGSFTRSGLNYTAGAVTPLSAVFAALWLLAIVLIVAPLAGHLPIAAMAGILLLVAWRLIDFHHIRTILKAGKGEAAVLLTTLAATLFVELEFAIYVGVILSLVLYLNRTSKPRIISRVPDTNHKARHLVSGTQEQECPQLKIIRIDGSLFFGAVDHVQETLHNYDMLYPEQRHLLIVANGINFIDVAGAELLVHEAERRRKAGGGLYFAKVKEEVLTVLQRGGFLDHIGRENIFETKAEAIEAIFAKVDANRCTHCTKRIFLECQTVAPSPVAPASLNSPIGANR